MPNKLTKNEFISKAKLTHGNKYDYSEVLYINSKSNVIINCPLHHKFSQRASHHLTGSECPKCANISATYKKTKTIEEFIKRAIEIHGKKYNYSDTIYKNSKFKIKIKCWEHGYFYQLPDNHLKGKGCPKCNGKNKTTNEMINEFIKIHGDKYDYTRVEYKGIKNEIRIICPLHGEFTMSAEEHRYGNGCSTCINLDKLNNFIINANRIHNNKYDYSLCSYIKPDEKIKIICPLHGVFEQFTYKHLNNNECPVCRTSKGEKIIRNYFISNKIKFIQQYKFKNCRNKNELPFDFYLPKYNTCIEYNGEQHYKPIKYFGGEIAFRKQIKRDFIKKNYCIDNNIHLLIITHNDNIENKIKNYFDNLLINSTT